MDGMGLLFDHAVADYRQRLVAAIERMGAARDPLAFTGAEREVLALTQKLAGAMTQRVVQQVSKDRDRRSSALSNVRARAATKGIKMRLQRDRRTEFRTLGGQLVDVITPYASAHPRGSGKRKTRGPQGTGVYYVLDELGITGRSTPALRLLVSHAVCEANSVGAARALLAGGGVEIDHKAALRLTYLTTEIALQARAAAIKTTNSGDAQGEFVGRRVVAAVDGGRVQIRRRVAGRPKKGGRKHFVTEWREPKILTLYVLGEDGKRDRTVPSVIDGTLGDADAVFALLRYHLLRLGAHEAAELTLLGDGADWIWKKRAEELRVELGLPRERFHEITDYFHVVERIGKVAKLRQRWSDEERVAWVHEQKTRLKGGQVEEIEAEMRRFLRRRPKERETEAEFWSRNRERLRYAKFRQQRLPVGSGAVESAVRRVINLRMKSASVTWTEEHAEGVLHLRAHAKSGRWAELEETVLCNTGWRPTARLLRSAA